MHPQEDMLFISKIFILQQYRKQGIGKEIITLAKKNAIDLGLKKLKVSISQDDKINQNIAEKLNFKFHKELGRFIGNNVVIFENCYLLDVN